MSFDYPEYLVFLVDILTKHIYLVSNLQTGPESLRGQLALMHCDLPCQAPNPDTCSPAAEGAAVNDTYLFAEMVSE